MAWDARTKQPVDMLWQLPKPQPQSYYQEIEQCKHMDYHCNGCNCNGLGREKLFSKVVTQSDIKQYRLSIPKNQAKKHFYVARKDALLPMVDDGGKVWKFRYSFWKSTQTWVFTGGWNQFVKEKGLRVGDKISFLRSAGRNKHLYIDWESKIMIINPVPKPQGHVIKLFGVNISI
uniref:AP2/ERF transcription factor n=1 Tax=Camptotheca acuminata TaxID=16922 RepID=A0A7G8AUA8_CAMAC|nr:AP2/ERF transcription factor [Camptotheca acuminata]